MVNKMQDLCKKHSSEYESLKLIAGETCILCLREQVKQLQAELDKHRWIPVSERLPKLNDCPHPHSPDVLLALSEIYLGWLEKDRGWRHGDGTVEVFPTHWKPIILPDQTLKDKK